MINSENLCKKICLIFFRSLAGGTIEYQESCWHADCKVQSQCSVSVYCISISSLQNEIHGCDEVKNMPKSYVVFINIECYTHLQIWSMFCFDRNCHPAWQTHTRMFSNLTHRYTSWCWSQCHRVGIHAFRSKRGVCILVWYHSLRVLPAKNMLILQSVLIICRAILSIWYWQKHVCAIYSDIMT